MRVRWSHVEELYQDNRQDTLGRIGIQDKYIITGEEVRSIIEQLTEGKASGRYYSRRIPTKLR